MSPLNPISGQLNQRVAQAQTFMEKRDQRAAIQVFLDWKIPEDNKQEFWENVKSRLITHLAIKSTIPLTAEKAKDLVKESLAWFAERKSLQSKIAKEKTDHLYRLVEKRNTIAQLEKQLLKK